MKGYWKIRHLDAQGRLLYEEEGFNTLHDEGEEFFIKVLFTETDAVPANYYLGMDNRSSVAEAQSLTDLVNEPSGNGYARIAVASDDTDWTAQQDAGTDDWEAESKEVTFTASGGSIGPVQKLFLCDVATGTAGLLIATKALSQSRTLADGESLNCRMTVRMSE